MQFKDIIRKIKSLNDYDPETEQYAERIREQVRDKYQELSQTQVWPWAQVQKDITVYGDVEINAAVVNGNVVVDDALAPFLPWMVGQTLVAEDATEYTIVKVNSTTQIVLDKAWAGVTGTDTAEVTYKYVVLPTDLTRLLTAVDPATNDVYFCESRGIADMYLDKQDNAGTPDRWIPSDSYYALAPVLAPTLTANTGAGTMTEATYEVAYSYTYLGVESDLSPSATIEVEAGVNRDLIVNTPDTLANSGRTKNIYIRIVTDEVANLRAFRLVTADVPETTVTTTYAVPVETTWRTGGAARVPENGGMIRRIRLYDRPGSDLVMRIRYLRRPPQLIEDTDTPEFDPTFHQYLVFAGLVEILLLNDKKTAAKIYADKEEAMLLRLTARYLTEDARHIVRGSAWGGRYNYSPWADGLIIWEG